MLSVSVLGPVELRRDDELLALRPGKTTELLVRLALDAGTAVRAERLIEDLWGADAVATRRNTLQTKVSRLRREIGDPELVSGGRAGYTLHVDPAAVDALTVVTLADLASARLAAGDPAGAVAATGDALGRFRGDVLPDAGDAEWVVPHRVRLEEVRLALVEQHLEGRMALGGAGALVGELEVLVASHPLREHLWALLITALYRDGRQADALAAYQRVRELLVDELGVDPGPELRALEQRVLMQDAALDATPDHAGRILTERGNLPALTADLVGRDAEQGDLAAALDAQRLVTVVGPAGVGKTRLAIEVATTTGGARTTWLVRLDAAASSAAVVETVGAALGLNGPTEALIVDRLKDRDVLLVLDNCEHVLDTAAALTRTLLDAAPDLRVLATSQAPLRLPGESVLVLEPLAPADASELFARRAGERRASFVLDDETGPVVDDVCRALDGLPLAIELAAARTKVLSVQEIARRLDDRFALLRDPTSPQPARQQALDAAITWSYDLLFPDDQRGLWALACFSGGASLDALVTVLDALDVPEANAIDIVTRLADRSLVVVEPTSAGATRYRLLESVRAYARDRGADALPTAAAAHARWIAAAADAAATELRGPRQAEHLRVAGVERANIDVALAGAVVDDPALALRIVNGFGWAWVVAGDGAPAAARLRAALAAAGDAAPTAERVTAWSHVAWLDAGTDVGAAEDAAQRAVEAAADDDALGAVARLALAYVLIQQARPRDALPLLTAAREVFRRADRQWEEGAALVLTVHAALMLGDTELVAQACADADRVVRTSRDDWGIGHLEAVLGRLARAEGRPGDAAQHLGDAADAAARLGFATSEGYHRVNLGRARLDAGEVDDAATALERARTIGLATGELRLAALARTHLADVRLAQDRAGDARTEVEAADDWYRRSGGGDGAARATAVLATLDLADGRADAEARVEAARARARADGDAEVEALCGRALAAAAAAHA